ncbi:MAG: hypothetical protein R3258_10150, partial [Acidimicrobiia bacterium]|nr:hypothetical protein [Acidimicrobiia bacterium]
MRPSIAVLALVVACTQGAAPTTTEATTTTVPTTTSTSLPTTTTTLQAGVAWDQISASPWLVSDYQGVRTAGGDVLWEPSLLLGGAGSIVRDGEGGFAWADGDGLWWLPAGAPQPRLVMTGVQQVFRAIPTAGAPAALIWVDDSAHPFWIDLDTGERQEPEAPGLVTLDDPYLTAVWYAANGLAAVVTAPSVLHDAEGQPTTIESPGRLIVGYAPDPESGYTEKTILTRDSTGDLVINLDGPHVLNVALSTLESPWVRLHDFDGQRIIVSRGPFEPAMPEESFLYIDLGCGSCFTVFRASAAWAVLVGTDPTDVPVFDRQAPQLLASWPGTDAGVTELGDGV